MGIDVIVDVAIDVHVGAGADASRGANRATGTRRNHLGRSRAAFGLREAQEEGEQELYHPVRPQPLALARLVG